MSHIVPEFTIGQYNSLGYKIESGIILYFGHTSIRVCDSDKKSLCDFIKELEEIRDEILPQLIE